MSVNNDGIDTNWVDADDAPELTDEWFARAALMSGEKLVRRGGHPRGSDKEQVTLPIDKSCSPISTLPAQGGKQG